MVPPLPEETEVGGKASGPQSGRTTHLRTTASAPGASAPRSTHDERPTRVRFRDGWSHPRRFRGRRPARLRAPRWPPHKSRPNTPLRQLPQHRIVLVVALDDRPGVGRLQRLVQEADLPGDPRDGLVEGLDVVDWLSHDLLVSRRPEEPPLPVRVPVAQSDQLLVAFLDRLQPREPLIQRDLRHTSPLVSPSLGNGDPTNGPAP